MSQTEELTCAVTLSLSRYWQVVIYRFPDDARRVTITDAERLCEDFELWLKQAQHLLARVTDSEDQEYPIDRSNELRRACKFAKTLMPQIVTLREGIRDYRAGKAKLLSTVLDEIRAARSSSG